MPADVKTAAPSTADLNTAQDAALAANDFTRYQEVENSRESNQALPEAPPPSTETSVTAPASEPGTANEIQEKKPKNGEDRKAELNAEIRELLKKRDELKTEPGVKVAEPPPAAVKPAAEAAKPAAGAAPVKPKLDDFANYAEFDAAKDTYIEEMVAFTAAAVIAKNEAQREQNAKTAVLREAWNQKIAAGKEEHADFAEVAFSKETPITSVMNDFILRSGVGPQVLYKLGENGSAEGKRIAAMEPYEALEALVTLKLSLGAAPVKKENVTTPVKKHTAAPPPATSLGGTATEPADAAEKALAAGDFGSYMAQENAREMKASRGA
jgi:hypothetical protein